MAEAQLKSEASITPEDTAAARAKVTEIMEYEGLTQADVAKESGIKYGTFTSWYKGTYTGDVARFTGEVVRWLAAREENRRAATAIHKVPGFQMTDSAKEFINAFRFAQIMPEISVVAGGAGVGKTSACVHYKATNPNVWHATMQPSSSSVYPMLGEIAEVMGVEEKVQTKLPRAIGRKLDGRQGLIIVDEAQHLSTPAMEQLRSLHDRYGVGVSLVGNESVYARLEGAGRERSFAQLFSRIGIRVTQSKARPTDMCALLEAWEVTDPEELKYLKGVGAKPGALRVLTKTLQLASMLAAGARQERGIKHIRAAWARLSTSPEAA